MSTQVTRADGKVRAYEPRIEGDNRPGFGGVWKCRGRVTVPGGYRGTDGKPRNTRQCNSRLTEGQLFCGKCGGLVAWGGVARYGGVELRHLETLELN